MPLDLSSLFLATIDFEDAHKMFQTSLSKRTPSNYPPYNILKLNHKSFHQIVVLGSSNFIPFMQLKTRHRREVIEDLLDIGIFTKMNAVLREKLSTVRGEINYTNSQITVKKEKIGLQEKHIKETMFKHEK